MKLILEKAEIVKVLSAHFGAKFDPEKVVIRTEPFEIELHDLPLSDPEPPAAKKPPEFGPQEYLKDDEDAGVDPTELIKASKSLEEELWRKRQGGSRSTPKFDTDEIS